MLYKQTISPFFEETLKKLMRIKELEDFRLVKNADDTDASNTDKNGFEI